VKKIKNINGVILTEALIAVAMLVIASVATTSVIKNSVNATKLSKNYLIAENYLTEGIEVVESIRNSNWLRKPLDKESCWLVPNPDISASANCDLVNTEKYYKIAFVDNNWRLVEENNNVFKIEANPNFERKITFLEIDSDKAIFSVELKWMDGAKDFSISRNHILYNYK